MPRSKSKDNFKRMTVEVPTEMEQRLREIASEVEVSRNRLCVMALSELMSKYESH